MMKILKFNTQFYNDIINGKKTQTLRKSNKRLVEDELVKAVFNGTDKECTLKITKSDYKRFGDLTAEDAELEGCSSLDELKEILYKLYPRISNLQRLYYYRFVVVE